MKGSDTMIAVNTDLFKKCVDHWGEMSQYLMVIEEINELVVEICHALRGNRPFDIDAMVEEIADARLMIDQLQYMLRIADVDVHNMQIKKIVRLNDLIETEQRMMAELGEDP